MFSSYDLCLSILVFYLFQQHVPEWNFTRLRRMSSARHLDPTCLSGFLKIGSSLLVGPCRVRVTCTVRFLYFCSKFQVSRLYPIQPSWRLLRIHEIKCRVWYLLKSITTADNFCGALSLDWRWFWFYANIIVSSADSKFYMLNALLLFQPAGGCSDLFQSFI